jgi:hypothetical protein
MKFTTKLQLKKDKPEEKYPYPVLTQHSYNVEIKGENTKFSLNQAAMVEFGFTPDTANVNKINWGIDEETGDLMLANTKGLVRSKLSQITANNTFSNQSFLDRLVNKFTVDPLQVHEFKLNLQPDENDFIVATMELISEEVLANDDELEANIDKFNEGLKDIQKEAEQTIW